MTTTILLTIVTMVTFAANSLLARVAIREGAIDPVTFTTVRILAGAVFLWLVIAIPRGGKMPKGSFDWRSGLVLFGYAIAFSLAYLDLTAGTGALILFGSVQITMIAAGLMAGERFKPQQIIGAVVALAGLVYLVLPSVSAPSFKAACLMAASGVAWGFYSLLGKKAENAGATTAGNFLIAAPLAIVVYFVIPSGSEPTAAGIWWAVLSGAITSGLGYIVWYKVIPALGSLRAAVSQLSVPIIAALAGTLLLSEQITATLAVSSVVTLGGIALAIAGNTKPKRSQAAD
jgi:drug/metabolite transporter (DMT)-like permease